MRLEMGVGMEVAWSCRGSEVRWDTGVLLGWVVAMVGGDIGQRGVCMHLVHRSIYVCDLLELNKMLPCTT